MGSDAQREFKEQRASRKCLGPDPLSRLGRCGGCFSPKCEEAQGEGQSEETDGPPLVSAVGLKTSRPEGMRDGDLRRGPDQGVTDLGLQFSRFHADT